MITIKKSDNQIEITGHANYSNKEDIVCASVSSIMYTTVNAILKFNNKAIEYSDDTKKVTIKVIEDTYETNILITNMIDLFQSLEKDYPKNIRIEMEE